MKEKMSLPKFLKEVDRLSAALSHEQLEAVIHETARTLSESKRDQFLSLIHAMRDASNHDAGANEKVEGVQGLLADIEAIKEQLIEINDGERLLDSEYNEEWDDWYNSDADEVLFTDPEEVLEDIDAAIYLIHRCVDEEAYHEGCELAELLSVLVVSAEGDYEDFSGQPLYLPDLNNYQLLSGDFHKFILEALYLTYMGNEPEDRADEMFCMIEHFQCGNISLEDIMQSGNEELDHFDEFLISWIAYLGTEKGRIAEKLLLEAQSMLGDEDALLENARKYVNEHPALYEQILQNNLLTGKNEKMLAIGEEALASIPDQYAIKSRIALLSAEYAIKLSDFDKVEWCWVEAFRSDSSPMNYMRLLIRSRDFTLYKSTLSEIYEAAYQKAKAKGDTYIQGYNNSKGYYIMKFFDGQFDEVMKSGMNVKGALGWSSTFMKEGLSLFLLLLFEGQVLSAGMSDMCRRAVAAISFDWNKLNLGEEEQAKLDNAAFFWEAFINWKTTVSISEIDCKGWMSNIERWIELRVKGIMEGNYRKYYGECAAYIAALGEVQEALGEKGAKSRIMMDYRNRYSRRRAFHQELRVYGMRS